MPVHVPGMVQAPDTAELHKPAEALHNGLLVPDRRVVVLRTQALGKQVVDRQVVVLHMLAADRQVVGTLASWAAHMWVEERDKQVGAPGTPWVARRQVLDIPWAAHK